jgi:hypothetical protein
LWRGSQTIRATQTLVEILAMKENFFTRLSAFVAEIYTKAGKMIPATKTHYALGRGRQGAYRRKGPGRWHQGQENPAGSKLAGKATRNRIGARPVGIISAALENIAKSKRMSA